MDLLTVATHLNVTSPVQKKVVEILSNLSGYSKRLSLLEVELSKHYNSKTIKDNLLKMQQYKLAYVKNSTGGPRFYLDKDIWLYPTELYKLLRVLSLKIYKSSRSDIKPQGLLKKYKTSATSRNSGLKAIPHKFWKVTLQNYLRKEFKNRNEKIKPKDDITIDSAIKTDVESRSHNDSSTYKIGRRDFCEEEIILEYDDTFPINLKELLEAEIGNVFPVIDYETNVVKILIPLSLGRSQKVFITVRRAESYSKIFWISTICGSLHKCKTPILNFFNLNNEPHPIKIAVKEVNNLSYLICALVIPFDNNWGEKLKDGIIKVAHYGDRIENTFWHEDLF